MKILKSRIFLVIVTAFICITCTVYALNASEINYNDTTLDNALNTLYTKANKKLPDTLSIPLVTITYNTTMSTSTYTLTPFRNSYNYFKLINLTLDENMSSCQLRARINGENSNLSTDTDYSLPSITSFWANAKGKSTDQAYCNYTLVLHN